MSYWRQSGRYVVALKCVHLIFAIFDKLYYLLIEIDAPKNQPLKEMGYEEAYNEICDEVTNKTIDDRGGVNCIFLDTNPLKVILSRFISALVLVGNWQ
mgnify:CR=1 FL=1